MFYKRRTFKKGQAGMNFMIVFLSMLVVLAIAAIVIISSSATTSNKAKVKTAGAFKELTSAFMLLDLIGTDGTTGELTYWKGTLKLFAGSDMIRFSEVAVYMTTDYFKHALTYNSSINCSRINQLNGNVGHYGIEYQAEAENHIDGFFARGDVPKFCFKAPQPLDRSENAEFTFVPIYGKIWSIKVQTPEVILENETRVFP